MSSSGGGERKAAREMDSLATSIAATVRIGEKTTNLGGPSPGAKMALGQGFAVGSSNSSSSNSSSNSANTTNVIEATGTMLTGTMVTGSTATIPPKDPSTTNSPNPNGGNNGAPLKRDDDWGMSGLADILRLAQASQAAKVAASSTAATTANSTVSTPPGGIYQSFFAATILGYDPDSLGLGLDRVATSGCDNPGTLGVSPSASSSPPLCQTFLSPWLDEQQQFLRRGGVVKTSASTAASMVVVANPPPSSTLSLEAILPTCYNVQPTPPPVPGKLAAFSDETLFYMFYAMPRDRMQEAAAKELRARGWRFHKELRVWILRGNDGSGGGGGKTSSSGLELSKGPEKDNQSKKDSTDPPSPFGYILFEPKTWSRVNGTVILDEALLERADEDDNMGESSVQQQQQQPSPLPQHPLHSPASSLKGSRVSPATAV